MSRGRDGLGPKCPVTIGINLIIAFLKHKRNRKFDFFSVRSIFISLINTKSSIFTRAPPLVKILLLVFIR